MKKSLEIMLNGYRLFRDKYVHGDFSVMQSLSEKGQQPTVMIIACSDSRVDPALILQCDPGDLFVVRNVANIVPMYELDDAHHGTSAALEFGICFLNVKHLILLGHSCCGGIQALLSSKDGRSEIKNDFINNWVSLVKPNEDKHYEVDEYAKIALDHSFKNCLTFPWIKQKVAQEELIIHRWFFDLKQGQLFNKTDQGYQPIL